MSPMSNRSKSSASLPLALAAALFAFSACDKSDSGTDPVPTTKLINVSSPATGSAWKVGDSLAVKWTVKTNPNDPSKAVDAVDISISPDAGANWKILNPGSIPLESAKWGNYKWLIPDSLSFSSLGKVGLKGKTCRMKVEQYSTQDPDLSFTTGDFTISP
jgi:hypothetical protein